jgi:hypothetical protein
MTQNCNSQRLRLHGFLHLLFYIMGERESSKILLAPPPHKKIILKPNLPVPDGPAQLARRGRCWRGRVGERWGPAGASGPGGRRGSRRAGDGAGAGVGERARGPGTVTAAGKPGRPGWPRTGRVVARAGEWASGPGGMRGSERAGARASGWAASPARGAQGHRDRDRDSASRLRLPVSEPRPDRDSGGPSRLGDAETKNLNISLQVLPRGYGIIYRPGAGAAAGF